MTTPRAVEQRFLPSDLAELLGVGVPTVNRFARSFGAFRRYYDGKNRAWVQWITPAGVARVIIAIRAEQGELLMADPRKLTSAQRVKLKKLLADR